MAEGTRCGNSSSFTFANRHSSTCLGDVRDKSSWRRLGFLPTRARMALSACLPRPPTSPVQKRRSRSRLHCRGRARQLGGRAEGPRRELGKPESQGKQSRQPARLFRCRRPEVSERQSGRMTIFGLWHAAGTATDLGLYDSSNLQPLHASYILTSLIHIITHHGEYCCYDGRNNCEKAVAKLWPAGIVDFELGSRERRGVV